MTNTKREIKFRAWDRKNKVMFYEFSISSSGKMENYILPYQLREPRVVVGWEDFEFQQFTEVKTKDGIDIFDGDIIQKDNDLFLVFYDDGVPMYKGIKRRIVDRFLLTNRSE